MKDWHLHKQHSTHFVNPGSRDWTLVCLSTLTRVRTPTPRGPRHSRDQTPAKPSVSAAERLTNVHLNFPFHPKFHVHLESSMFILKFPIHPKFPVHLKSSLFTHNSMFTLNVPCLPTVACSLLKFHCSPKVPCSP